MRGFAIAALALAGLLFAWTPLAERADLALLDGQLRFLRNFIPRTAPDDIIVVGLDEATLRAVAEPVGMWHEPLARVLAKLAGAKPRAIGLDLVLPDRSWDDVRPGLDRTLMLGLLSARDNGPLVASLSIDPRTRSAKSIFTPFVAVLREERLGIGLFGRDPDGVVRRFSLAIPTQDSSFPTFAGRLCQALSKQCRDGLIDFGFGAPFRQVPMHEVLTAGDPEYLARLFRDRIVLIGETQRFADRVAVPINLAGWEAAGRDMPGVVVHAAALRSALHGRPPLEAAKPVTLLLLSAAALLAFVRDWRLALLTGVLGAVALLVFATTMLHAGRVVEISAALFTLALAWMSRAAFESRQGRRERLRLREGFAGHVSPAMLQGMQRGEIATGEAGERRELAFLFAELQGCATFMASTTPEDAIRLLNRFHEPLAAAIHRHEGMLDALRGEGVMAVFGAPKRLPEPGQAACAAAGDMFRALVRLNADLAREGKPTLALAAGIALGDALVGGVGTRERLSYATVSDAARLAVRLQEMAKRGGYRVVVSGITRDRLAEGDFETVAPLEGDARATSEAFGWR